MNKTILFLMVFVFAGCSATKKQQAIPRADINTGATAVSTAPPMPVKKEPELSQKTLKGVAFDYMGPIGYVEIRLIDKDGNRMEDYRVGSNGEFNIPLPADTHTISFFYAGYISREIKAKELKKPDKEGAIRLDVEMASEELVNY